MSVPLLIVVSVLYLGVALDLGIDHRYGLALTFVAYALANGGLILAILRGEGA
jgi:ABC-type amino acid transport system permease subunit